MSRYSRRRFIGQSAAAAAAVWSAPWIIARGAQDAGKATDLLGVAVVGVGGRGSDHLAAFLSDPRVRIAWVVDVDEQMGQRGCRAAIFAVSKL